MKIKIVCVCGGRECSTIKYSAGQWLSSVKYQMMQIYKYCSVDAIVLIKADILILLQTVSIKGIVLMILSV